MLRILQINAGRSVSAHDMATVVASKCNYDFIAFGEPNLSKIKGTNNYASIDGGAMILNHSQTHKVMRYRILGASVCVETEEWALYNIYVSPNKCTPEDFENHLADIQRDLQQLNKEKKIIITGDFNARHPVWGGNIKNKRGKSLLEWANALNMNIMNDGLKPTCIRPNGESFIDVTMICNKTMSCRPLWEVLDDESMSDHRFTSMETTSTMPNVQNKYVYGRTDYEMLNVTFKEKIRGKSINEIQCERAITQAYKSSTPRVKCEENNKLPYWWNVTIQKEIFDVRRKRRSFQRCKNTEHRESLQEDYKISKSSLKRAISIAKKKSWDNLCKNLDSDVYGDAFKIVKSQLKAQNPKTNLTLDETTTVAISLFITTDEMSLESDRSSNTSTMEDVAFGEEEITEAAKKIKTGKTPGPDSIPPEVIKEVMAHNVEYFRKLFDGLLRAGNFPETWKTAKLVLIEKPKKNPNDPPKYRPICLLNVLAKIFESLINKRLINEIKEKGDFNDGQYGFRQGRTTVDAVNRVINLAQQAKRENKINCLILIDVKNAFNTASWPLIIAKLKEKGISLYLRNILTSYLTNRYIILQGKKKLKVTGGVPQGSVLGPTLWNILYDGVMDLRMLEEITLICYADDLAVSVTGQTKREVIAKANATLHAINIWMRKNHLQMAPEKTEAIILNKKRNIGDICFAIGETTIRPANSVTYLGVTLDRGLTMSNHIQKVCDKSHRVTRALCMILPNIRGPNSNKRRILAMATQSVITYAAPIWAHAMSIDKYRHMVLSAQRIMALRVCSAYKTVSTEAALVIAGLIPIDLVAKERSKLYYRREATVETERMATLDQWQQQWEQGVKGRWTFRLIRHIRPWFERQHGQVSFRLTQCLSGHGVFYSYLHKITRAESAYCVYCGESPDDAEHTIFDCARWETERHEAALCLRMTECLSPDNLINQMLRSPESWNIVVRYLEGVMTIKEEDERRMKAQPFG
jgi:hypothetical protein